MVCLISTFLWIIMAKEVPQLVKAALRAVLLSQKGIKQTDLPRDYKKLNDSQLDVKKYGFQDLHEFLLAIPDVARLEYSPKDGENKVFGVVEKGIFISDHAKKNMGVPNGLKPLHPSQWPRNVNKNERTSVSTESDSKKKIMPNSSGLYAIHVKNLPPNCQQVRLCICLHGCCARGFQQQYGWLHAWNTRVMYQSIFQHRPYTGYLTGVLLRSVGDLI